VNNQQTNKTEERGLIHKMKTMAFHNPRREVQLRFYKLSLSTASV